MSKTKHQQAVDDFNKNWNNVMSNINALGDWMEVYDKKDFQGLSDKEWYEKANSLLAPILEKYEGSE